MPERKRKNIITIIGSVASQAGRPDASCHCVAFFGPVLVARPRREDEKR